MNKTLELLKSSTSYLDLLHNFCKSYGKMVGGYLRNHKEEWYIYDLNDLTQIALGPYGTEIEAYAECIYMIMVENKFS